jgi:hemoglobin
MSDEVPTLYEWIGGRAAIERLMTRFYERVPSDPLIAPLFAAMDPAHAEHVAAFVGEVFGGPKAYSEQHGGHPAMIRHHIGKRISEEQRERWMSLLLACANEVGIPTDPEFRSAFVAYVEWGTRLAVVNSAPDAAADENAPMPRWGWGEPKGPYRG